MELRLFGRVVPICVGRLVSIVVHCLAQVFGSSIRLTLVFLGCTLVCHAIVR